jgi:hypothetical protein
MSRFDAIQGQFDVGSESIEREIAGVECNNSFGIIVEAKGVGAQSAPIAEISSSGHREIGKS